MVRTSKKCWSPII